MLPYEKEKIEILTKYRSNISTVKRKDILSYGLINLNKPSGKICSEVLNEVRRILHVKKAGYAGTLDPKVTGVLPIGLGKATKVMEFFSLGGKKYKGTMYLHKSVDKKNLDKAVKKFTGKIKQKPPILSSVKRVEREREVYALKLTEVKGRNIKFQISCQHGFYVRKFCHDFGEYLGVGAHMTFLERIQAAHFKIEESITLEELKKNYSKWQDTGKDKYLEKIILPIEEAVSFLPKVWIDDDVIEHVSHGSPIFVPAVLKLTSNIKEGSNVAIFNTKNQLIGIGIAEMNSKDILNREKGLAIKTNKVLITSLYSHTEK